MIRAIATVIAGVLMASCAPVKPKTNTAAPSLGTASSLTRQITNDISDAKGGVHRARTLNERIDYKASLLN